MATATLFVLVVLAVFNFLASVIQGVAGIGDAIFLQVLWYIACKVDHETFLSTPLGTEPIQAIALLMYIRLLFIAPLVVYLGFSESIFSKTMTIAMAVPNIVFSIIGVYLFTYLNGDRLKTVLGVSSLVFAIMYACILLVRFVQRRRTLQHLKHQNVKVVVEANALADDLHRSRNASITELQNSFMLHVPNNSVVQLGSLLNTCVLHNMGHDERNAETKRKPSLATRTFVNTISFNNASSPLPVQQRLPLFQDQTSSNTNKTLETINQNLYNSRNPAIMREIHEETGRLSTHVEEALVSTITGDVFVPQEAVVPHVCEENVPPLTPSKLSPSRTMTFTRVRVNRNLDSSGHIKLATKVGAAVAASLAGLMASLTGVNAPPQIIFILLFNAPNYMVRVNFSAQSIPANLIRFVMAANQHLFQWNQVPLFIVSIVFGYAGVFVGHHIGRVLGPKSFNLFVLCLLLLSALVMITSSVIILLFCTLLTVIATGVSARVEMVKNRPIIVAQREAEMEIEKRIYDVMEFLERNQNNSFNEGATHPTSLHDNAIHNHEDNDDDSSNSTKTVKGANKDDFVLNRNKREVRTYSTSRPKVLWNNFDNDDDNATATAATSIISNKKSNNGSDICDSVHGQYSEREVSYHNNNNNRYSEDDTSNSHSKAPDNSNNVDSTSVPIDNTLTTNTNKETSKNNEKTHFTVE